MKRIITLVLGVMTTIGVEIALAQASSHTAITMGDTLVKPFQIAIDEEAIDDLKRRLASTRLPDQLDGVSWEYGTDLSTLTELIDYWREDFDWRAQASRLNRFDQVLVDVDGHQIHTIHHRAKNANAIPLMLVHGWPEKTFLKHIQSVNHIF